MVEHGSESWSARSAHNVGLFLALYLLLVAFFVVLYSISQREEVRTVAAIGSLTATFGSQGRTAADTPQFTASPAMHDPLDSIHRRVRKVFESEIAIARFEILQMGRLMRVLVPSRAFFAAGDSAPRLERAPLMNTLADALSPRSGGWRYEIEVVIGSGRSLPPYRGGPSLAARRAEAIGRDLRARGVAATVISTGVAAGDPATISLSFLGRAVALAEVTFEQLER